MRTCTKCKIDKILDDFYSSKGGKFGKSSWCKDCHKIHWKNYRNNNQEQIKISKEKWRKENEELDKNIRRKWKLRTKYGISENDYNRIFENQEGRCAICGKHQSELEKRLYIDHDHLTNRVRGLLCDGCNFGLGHFNDDPYLLTNAILYLKDSLIQD